MKDSYFLLLISLGLWKDIPELTHRLKNEIYELDATYHQNWSSVVQMADFQSVTGFLYRGKRQLSTFSEKEMEGFLECTGQLIHNNKTINDVLVDAVRVLDDKCIPYCLLKGQGIGSYYEDPGSRLGGDIDLYVGRYQQEAIDALLPLTISGHYGIRGKHANLLVKGIEIELHKYVDSMICYSKNESFWRWSDRELFGNVKIIKIEDYNVKIPAPTFNAFSTFYHLFRHFLISGVGLRQLCDWARLLYSEKECIDREELIQRLSEYGISEGMGCIHDSASRVLGAPFRSLYIL